METLTEWVLIFISALYDVMHAFPEITLLVLAAGMLWIISRDFWH